MPDPTAEATNAENLRVYSIAHEQGILESIVVDPGPGACDAVKEHNDRYGLWDLPPLPVKGCDDQKNCACLYRAIFNRDIRVHMR